MLNQSQSIGLTLSSISGVLCSVLLSSLSAQTIESMPEVVVEGKAESLIGEAIAASKGQSSAEELEQRPFLRRGELLEVVPGMIITQHAGDGKANQYFLRGFNLDHATDFGISVDGMPINMRTHAHGQGYADLNPIIPELVEKLDYWKGPYYAHLGDLSAAGAAQFNLYDTLPRGLARFSFGENRYFRSLLADSVTWGRSTAKNPGPTQSFTYALEHSYYDGPWDLEQNSEKWNGLLRYVWKDKDERFTITAMGYDADWISTDQIPDRLVADGRLGRFGFIDPTNGGDSSRYSLLMSYDRELGDGGWHFDAWVSRYELELFSNFTYFLDDPVRGDQFEQSENRVLAGATLRRDWEFDSSTNQPHRLSLGFQTRHDWIDDIGLYKTSGRQRFRTVREDEVSVSSYSLFAEGEYRAYEWFRVTPGVRADLFHFDVTSDRAENTGDDTDLMVNPKLNFVLGPWQDTELYLNLGSGFHSNDARGVNTRVDAVSGERVPPVDPLVRLLGAEIGVRTEAMKNWVHTLSLWYLESESELVYVGDAGTNEAGAASRRYGLELANYWRPVDWFMFDSEFTLTHAEFKNEVDDKIPGSVPMSWSGGFSVGRDEGFFGSLRGRFFSPRPLEESGRIESKSSFQVNAKVGYRTPRWEVALECLNCFDRDDRDIEYFYDSRLGNEPSEGIADIHWHPAEPRTFRATLSYYF